MPEDDNLQWPKHVAVDTEIKENYFVHYIILCLHLIIKHKEDVELKEWYFFVEFVLIWFVVIIMYWALNEMSGLG
jgi:hypothetical protein